MKMIEKMIAYVCDELDGATCYAEKYIRNKTSQPTWAKMYHEMSEQEISHAGYLLQIGDEKIGALSWISEEDKEAWEKCHAKATEKMALARLMLSK